MVWTALVAKRIFWIKKKNFVLKRFKLLSYIKENPINKCDILKFFMSVKDNHSDYFSQLAKSVAKRLGRKNDLRGVSPHNHFVCDTADTHVRRFDKNSFSTEASIVSFRDVKRELTAVTRTRWLPVSPSWRENNKLNKYNCLIPCCSCISRFGVLLACQRLKRCAACICIVWYNTTSLSVVRNSDWSKGQTK